jgi:hypothetical protein
MAKKLLEGKFHEEDEDEDTENNRNLNNEVKFMTKEEMDHQDRLD